MEQKNSTPETTSFCSIHSDDYERGKPFSEVSIEDDCPACREFRAKRKIAECKARFHEMQIGKRFLDYQWRDYEEVDEEAKNNKAQCLDYAKNFEEALSVGRNGILMGTHGTGKNMLAALICKTLAAHGYRALHTTVSKLLRRIRETWGTNSAKKESEAITELLVPELLVIDEIGVQMGTQNEQNILFEVINDRYENRRPTLLITNLNSEGLQEFLGPRILDRFFEDGSFILRFTGESYRRRKASAKQ